ncbi:response regulator transcription factor [Pontibacillus salicampi]|uniref:Response regulator transcription factor n=1 Tax=Pontibacillus salicampi TaxID=1449801 RepID=A0ABV6LI07_9BACI
MAQVLVVEDEVSIRSFIVLNLKRAGYEVVEASTGEQALELYRQKEFSVIVLDLMLPGIDGMKVCEYIREMNSHIGIIMLTAKTQEEDKINGLVTGADDYIQKPFSPNELIARIKALLRRVSPVPSSFLSSGPFTFKVEEEKVWKNEALIELTPTEFMLLLELISHPKQLVTRHDLMDKVWGSSYMGDPKIVDVNIRRLRQKIEEDPSDPAFIVTSWGKGYEWSDSVT